MASARSTCGPPEKPVKQAPALLASTGPCASVPSQVTWMKLSERAYWLRLGSDVCQKRCFTCARYLVLRPICGASALGRLGTSSSFDHVLGGADSTTSSHSSLRPSAVSTV